MDEANGRGEANGYNPLAEGIFELRNAPDYLELPFTGSYADIAAKVEWTNSLPAKVRAAQEEARTATAATAAEEEATRTAAEEARYEPVEQ